MNYKIACFVCSLLFLFRHAGAQKPFTEGIIVYNVKLHSPEHKEFTGVYTFSIKGSEVRKELKLNNGYQDVVLLNSANNKAYSLQNRNGKKYAIELNMAEIIGKQDKFNGFVIKTEENDGKNIAGYAAYKGRINYRDGSAVDVLYTKEWSPALSVTFERFPGANFLPMFFFYKDDDGMIMEFEAVKIDPGPVESGVFRIPPDYKMISNAEYRQLSK